MLGLPVHQDPGLVRDYLEREMDLIIRDDVLPYLLRKLNQEIFLAHLGRDKRKRGDHLSRIALDVDVFGREESG
jgi:hypothetical protein